MCRYLESRSIPPEPRSVIETRGERVTIFLDIENSFGEVRKAAKDAKQTTLISTKSWLEEAVVVGGGTKVPTQQDRSNFRVTSIPRSRHFFSSGNRQLHGRQKIRRCSFPEKIPGKVDGRRFPVRWITFTIFQSVAPTYLLRYFFEIFREMYLNRIISE